MRHLQIGEDVIGAGDAVLGMLERLVVDERAHAVTHLVVDDHVVGVAHFHLDGDGGEGALRCDLDRAGLDAMPNVHDAALAGAPAHWEAPAGYALESFLRLAEALIGQGPYVPPVHIEPDLADIHEITEGSPVWYRDQQLGEVVMVRTDDAGAVADLVVQHGTFGESHLVPVAHVLEVIGNNVHVDVAPDAFRALPRFEEEPDLSGR